MARNYGSGPKSRSAVVKSCLGPRTVLVETDQSQTWMCHYDQLHFTKVAADLPSDHIDDILVLDQPIPSPPANVTTSNTTSSDPS